MDLCENCGCDKSLTNDKNCPICRPEEDVVWRPVESPQAEQATASCLSVLLDGVNLLIEKFDKLENANHDTAKTADSLHVRDTFTQAGTVYGICAEELRLLIGKAD